MKEVNDHGDEDDNDHDHADDAMMTMIMMRGVVVMKNVCLLRYRSHI